MNTIEQLGDEETFRSIVERTITDFKDSKTAVIGRYAFYQCSALASVELTAATSIGAYAFSSCNALASVELPVATSITNSAFKSCTSLTSISLPAAMSIENSAFSSCSKLTSVSLPSATSIDVYAFDECYALTSISLPVVTNIASSAFRHCNKVTTMYIGTKSNTICAIPSTSTIPVSVTDIYVPAELVASYKTATNWSSFASKIQSYEVPVSCQSLTITAEDVPGYRTSTKVYYEAVCTYSIEGVLQTGTKVFKDYAMSNTFDTNPSGESSRQVEISYTFLGQTATTNITQDKYIGNPVGGKIYYIDDTADGTYSFYDAEGNLMSDVSVGSTPSYYKVLTAGSRDKYYVYHDEIYDSFQWGKYDIKIGATGTAIGTGKSNTATLLATDAVTTANTIWYKLQQIRNAYTDGCNDWFIPSKDEVEALRLAIGCTTSTSGAVVVEAGAVTGGNIAGTADGKTHYGSYSGTYYCYPSSTKFLHNYIWSSSESYSTMAWAWRHNYQSWGGSFKNSDNPVFFIRAF